MLVLLLCNSRETNYNAVHPVCWFLSYAIHVKLTTTQYVLSVWNILISHSKSVKNSVRDLIYTKIQDTKPIKVVLNSKKNFFCEKMGSKVKT